MYTLMIVDDNSDTLQAMTRLLDYRNLGFTRVQTAASGFEAVTHVLDWKPDLCLISMCIGRDYGCNLIRNLEQMGVKSNYIMMGTDTSFENLREAMRCGALDYLLKPIEKEQLQECLQWAVSTKLQNLPGGVFDTELDPVLKRSYEEFSPLVRKILTVTTMEYGQHLSIKDIAEGFHMNATYLGQIFIRETKMKFSEYLMAYRLEAAKEKILHTREKISTIASEVGYRNMNYFYLHFQDYFQTSPTQMRERLYL